MRENVFSAGRAFRFRRFVRKSYSAFNSMHRQVSIGVLAGSMLTFVHATEVAAQSQTTTARDSLPEEVLELDELLVTSSKAELNLHQTAKIVSVITREDIARQPVQSVQDLLKNIVGLDVRQRGSNGVLAGISVRGGTFEQTAVLLNGANISNPQTAHYSLDIPVNLSDIEQIEIIQGPTSLLYGAGAFSGGVNIVTKNAPEKSLSLNLEGGMHSLFHSEARIAYASSPQNSNSLSLGYNTSSGYRDNSDYDVLNVFWQSRFQSSQSKLDIQAGFNEKKYGANTFYSAEYPNQYDDTRSIFASLRGEAGTTLKFIPQLYWNRHYDTFHLFRPGTFNVPDWYTAPNNHRTDVFGFNLNTQYKWRAGITNVGGEIRNEGIYSSVLGRPLGENKGDFQYSDHRTNISYFIEHTFIYHRFTLGVGLLTNYNTAFEDEFDFFPNLNLSYWLTDRWKIFASWNNATRMPTFTDLYYKGKTHKGNSDVRPEKSEAFELGAKYHTSLFSASISGFYMKGKRMIDWVKENPDDLWESRNLTNLDKIGFEAQFNVQLKAIHPSLGESRLDLGYMFIDQNKESGDLISNYVLDYLKHKCTIGLYHPIVNGFSADWQFRWQDRKGTYTKYEDLKSAYEAEYKPFGILDVKLNWKRNNWNVYVALNNVFDVRYFDLGNIPQPGHWFMGGVSYKLSAK
ncbi:TonB-dependent receptor [Bacteroidales bacterium OttesenSCG-928-A17]|nr:TonB-dependent receptor [Bacteroidales bacterium OttesenSCG-928-A17]